MYSDFELIQKHFTDRDDITIIPIDEMELCIDLLTCSDRLIVASEISRGVQREIEFAKLVKMEVLRLDENGELQPFTE